MKVYFDGKLVKTAPVTLGDDDWLSPTGYAVIMEQERKSKFNAGSIGLKPGDKGYYPPLTVEYANRLTTSGVYVHQALESAWGAVGKVNVSHGCVGLLPADAAWFFNNMKTGDVVQDPQHRGPGRGTARRLRRLEHSLDAVRQALTARESARRLWHGCPGPRDSGHHKRPAESRTPTGWHLARGEALAVGSDTDM